MVKELDFLQIYHLKDMFLSSEFFISCSVLQLTFYVICVSYTRRNGFVVLSNQIYHIGFLILFLTLLLILNEELLFQTFLSINDYLSFVSKLVICLSSLFFIFIIKTSFKDELMKHNFEYIVLILLGVLGSLLLCSSNDLLTAYLAMELQSVSFYLMASFKKNSNYSIESGLKYFIVGSFASALFLFGSSLIYGCIGSLNFSDFKLILSLLFVELNEELISCTWCETLRIFHFFLLSHSPLDCSPFNSSSSFEYASFFENDRNVELYMSWYIFLFENIINKESIFNFPDWFLIENNINNVFYNNNIIDNLCLMLFNFSEYSLKMYPSFECNFFAILPYFKKFSFHDLYYVANISEVFNTTPLIDEVVYDNSDSALLISNMLNEYSNSTFDGSISVIDNDVFKIKTVHYGFILICLSLLVKLAIAPFHFWSLDVYEGSPNSSTFFFAVVPKIGLFVLLIRLCYSGFYDILLHWQFYFLILSLLSIFVGSLGGLEQRKLKSLLAYSSISHSGYLLLSFSTNGIEGIQMMIYYVIIFMLSGLCFWSVYMFLRQKMKINYYNKQNKELGDLVLLRESNPMLALTLTLTLFSIAGIPPLVGFLAKLGIFLSALSSSTYVIALFGVLLSVISTFYYIRVIKILYFENTLAGKLYYSISTNKSILISVLLLSIVFICIYPMILYFVSHKSILLL